MKLIINHAEVLFQVEIMQIRRGLIFTDAFKVYWVF